MRRFSLLRPIRQRTIARDLVLGLSCTVLIVIVCVSILYYASSVSQAEQRLGTEASSHAENLSNNLAALLLLDETSKFIRYAWDYQSQNHIAGIMIYDADGKVVYRGMDPEITDTVSAGHEINWYGVKKLGNVEVFLGTEEISKTRKETIFFSLIVVFSTFFSILISVSILLNRYLARPLAKVEKGINAIAGGAYEHVIDSSGRLDIDAIIDSINAMARQIAARDRSLNRFATAVQQAEEAILILDRAAHIQYVNPAFESTYGYDSNEVLNWAIDCFVDRESRQSPDAVREAVLRGETWRGHLRTWKRDGTAVETDLTLSPVRDDSGRVVNYVAVARDVTERMRLEARMRQAQKIEALGTLAGGIAHDFNNILTPIIGYAQLMIDGVEGQISDEQRHDLERIAAAGLRAQDMIGQILLFARQGERERKPVMVGPIVKEALKLLRATLPSTIEIRQDIEALDNLTLADPTEIHQILLNLCANASHAMGDEPGTLDVSLSRMVADPDFCAQHPDLKEGCYLRLTVSDTGCGMSAEVLERIFEPFFTTKGAGEGTGMGLAIVHGIVRSLDGSITVYSELGRGTSVHVYFPEIVAASTQPSPVQEPVPGGDERILFVDDEQTIVDLVQRFMQSLGYRVVTTTSSVEALEWFRHDPQAFDLVITDLTMPKMTGLALTREILQIRPGLPVLLCTGFSGSVAPEKARAAGIRAVVLKPLTARELGLAVRRALDNQEQPSE